MNELERSASVDTVFQSRYLDRTSNYLEILWLDHTQLEIKREIQIFFIYICVLMHCGYAYTTGWSVRRW